MRAAIDGDRIVVVVRNRQHIAPALEEFEAANADLSLGAVIRKANGAEGVGFAGRGGIFFTTPRSNGLRGVALDMVFIDNDAHRVLDYERLRRFFEDVQAVLATSTSGKVVHS